MNNNLYRIKIKYYVEYLYRKLFTNFFEINSPRLELYVVNILYTLSFFFKGISWEKFANISLIETKFGKFYIKPNTYDVISVSPDFERQDISLIINTIKSLLKKNKSVVFLDIGAYLGLYSIILGKAFYKDKLSIYAFEPVEESYRLFNKNIEINNLRDKVKALNYGLYSEKKKIDLKIDSNKAGSYSIINSFDSFDQTGFIQLEILDKTELIKNINKDEVLLIKIDIEGAEIFALKGAENTMNLFSEVYISVEDCVDESILEYLKENHFRLVAKKSIRNSFWYKKNY